MKPRNKKIFSLLKFAFYSSLMTGISYVGIVYALNTWNTGYQLTSGQVTNITLADASCKKVTNNATNRFIPTKTMAEWNSFNAAAAGLGVTVGSCAVNCIGSWSNTSTCSASCGGGVLLQSYTISTPASGGGTACPYANGATQWGGTSCNTQGCPVNCSYTTYQGGTCSAASCGNYGIYYTITTPASNGGSCPVSEGQFVNWGGGVCNTQSVPSSTQSIACSSVAGSYGLPSNYTQGTAYYRTETASCLGNVGQVIWTDGSGCSAPPVACSTGFNAVCSVLDVNGNYLYSATLGVTVPTGGMYAGQSAWIYSASIGGPYTMWRWDAILLGCDSAGNLYSMGGGWCEVKI